MTVPADLLGVVLALLAAVMIASTGLLVRLGTNEGRAFDAVVVVLLVNLVILLPTTALLHYPNFGISPYAVTMFMLAGLVGTMLGRSLYFVSVSKIGASRSDAIKASQPLHATFVAILVLGETLTVEHLIGIVAITVGVGVVSLDLKSDKSGEVPMQRFLAYLVFPLGAAFFYGIEPTFAKLGFAEGTPLLVGLTIKTIVAFTAIVVVLYRRGELPTRTDFTRKNVYWYLAAGVTNTTFLGLYYGALEVAPVNIVIPLMQTSPFFVVLISYLALPKLERVTWRLVGGTIAVITGAVVIVAFV
ncbi:Uncharacterized membrane protein [Halopenitus malekzadehii]|uniref:Uncharacterized membrane protein n=1 Tax=Halopenitus malekzadehii TaxID=1267564 RepID=A0A1H6JSZ1_9EURY|nr:EamA family transporter [Halopenitus malekzadehii]SEH65694.1 Uncharacterized membrane protein [Halopenitus malekzadehii]